MKVTYTIRVRSGVSVRVPLGTGEVAIGAAIVSWKVEEAGLLEAVEFSFAGVEMRYAENGAILSTYQEVEAEAYRLVNFVADRLFLRLF